MAYDLLISRYGALAATAAWGSRQNEMYSGDKLVECFRSHIDGVDKFLADGRDGVVAYAVSRGYKAEPLSVCPGRPDHGRVDIVGMPPVGTIIDDDAPVAANAENPLVGLLTSRRTRIAMNGMDWILRSRASVTACALQKGSGRTKLWWSFEGIPASDDPDRRPTEDNVAEFVAFTDGLQTQAIPTLRTAYRDALKETVERTPENFELGEERLRISFADNDTPDVAALFDALYLEELKVSEIETRPVERLDEARTGLHEFVQFVDHVVKDEQHPPVNNDSVTVELQPSGVKGIVCRHRDENKHFRNFVGFARRPGVRSGFELLSNDEKRGLLGETRLRANSGARSFTAMLAGREALALEQRPQPS